MFESFKKAFKQEVRSADVLSPMKGTVIPMNEVKIPRLQEKFWDRG